MTGRGKRHDQYVVEDNAVLRTGPAATPQAAPGRPSPHRHLVVPGLLLTAIFIINFIDMPSMFTCGDAACWREEARSIVRDGRLWIDQRIATNFFEPGQFFVLNKTNGHWYSKFGIGNTLMSLPPTLMVRMIGEPSQLLIFNCYQIFLSLLLAGTLYWVSGWYTERRWTRVVFVLATFYTTFLWYYQRAITSEIYQILFFVSYFAFFMKFLRGLAVTQGRPASRHWAALLAAWFFVAALASTRILFGVMIPLTAIATACAIAMSIPRQLQWGAVGRCTAWLLVPATLIVVLLGIINQIKFGSPWLTGYHQWHPEIHFPTYPMWDGMYGFLFDPRYSIFLYFPVLVFALPAWRDFYRKHRLDAVTIGLMSLALMGILSKTWNWRGDATYGPRYMIFALPLMAIPFVLFIDVLWEKIRSETFFRNGPAVAAHKKSLTHFLPGAIAVVIVGCLVYSAYLQIQVNRLKFLAYYLITLPCTVAPLAESTYYFGTHHMGSVCDDVIRHRDRLDDLPWMPEMKRTLLQTYIEAYRGEMAKMVDAGNHYWFSPERTQ